MVTERGNVLELVKVAPLNVAETETELQIDAETGLRIEEGRGPGRLKRVSETKLGKNPLSDTDWSVKLVTVTDDSAEMTVAIVALEAELLRDAVNPIVTARRKPALLLL